MKHKAIPIFLFLIGYISHAQNDLNYLISKVNQFQYTNQDSTYIYADKTIDTATENKAYAELIYTLTVVNKSASYFNNLKKLKTNLDLTDSIFKANIKDIEHLEYFSYLKNTIIYDKGTYQYMTNNYQESKKEFETIITAVENIPDSLLGKSDFDMINGAYNFIAKMYSNEGKYDLATQYYTKNLRFTNEKMPHEKSQIHRIYSLLGEVYKREQQPEKSNTYYVSSLKYNIANNGNTNRIVTEASNIIENHLALSQTDSATYYLKLMKSFLKNDSPYLNAYYLDKAAIYESHKNTDSAVVAYQKALELTQAKWDHKKHTDVAAVYNDMALMYSKNNHTDQAIINLNKAIDQVSDNNKSTSSINQTVLLKTLKEKARLLNSLKSSDQFSTTLATVDHALTILDSLKPSFKSDTDKLLLIEDVFPVFESGIEAAYNLYQSTNDKSFINKAFFYSEKSKNVLLFEALLSAKATRFGTVPEALLEKEKQLKSEITELEKQLNSNKQVNDSQKDTLFKLKEAYRTVIKTIETKYKAYYDLKYNTQVRSLKELQNSLDSKTLLVSYFYGNNALYTISISNDNATFYKTAIDKSFNNTIINTYKSISNPKSDIQKLAEDTYYLYAQVLMSSIEDNTYKNKLIIIPDGLLNYIPFGSLNTSKTALGYLIEDHTISYVNSATLLEQLSENKKNNHTLLGFAPSFKNSENKSLLPLPNNKKEVQSILNYFEGKSLVDNQATLQNFTSENTNYGMLHLATHAIVNDENPEFSYLAFEPEQNHEDLLYVSDLYNLNLNANLVTLSACESGIGNLKRGEGFMSLARGFYFSGALSIASTLWKINDGSSSEIMTDFYKYLSEGKQKDEALQLAKLNFINANKQNALVHPYFWSGFVISGNTSAVTSSNYLIWLLFGITAIIIFGVVLKKRKNR